MTPSGRSVTWVSPLAPHAHAEAGALYERVEKLELENQRLRELISDVQADNCTLRVRIARAVELLRPFEGMANY